MASSSRKWVASSSDSNLSLITTGLSLVLLKEDSVLLERLSCAGVDDDFYRLPVGSMEPGQSVTDAATYAAKERLGVIVRREDISFVQAMHDVGADGAVSFFVVATRWIGAPMLAEPGEQGELRWCPVRSLPVNVAEPVRIALQCAGPGRDLSTYLAPDSSGNVGRDSIAASVSAFHGAFGLPRRCLPDVNVGDVLAKLRVDLLEEEVGEFVRAVAASDLVGIADALGDIVYVAYGTALTYGIDLDGVLAEIHKSNMSKLDAHGKPLLRDDGKVLKSEQYFRPDIAAVLARQAPLANC